MGEPSTMAALQVTTEPPEPNTGGSPAQPVVFKAVNSENISERLSQNVTVKSAASRLKARKATPRAPTKGESRKRWILSPIQDDKQIRKRTSHGGKEDDVATHPGGRRNLLSCLNDQEPPKPTEVKDHGDSAPTGSDDETTTRKVQEPLALGEHVDEMIGKEIIVHEGSSGETHRFPTVGDADSAMVISGTGAPDLSEEQGSFSDLDTKPPLFGKSANRPIKSQMACLPNLNLLSLVAPDMAESLGRIMAQPLQPLKVVATSNGVGGQQGRSQTQAPINPQEVRRLSSGSSRRDVTTAHTRDTTNAAIVTHKGQQRRQHTRITVYENSISLKEENILA